MNPRKISVMPTNHQEEHNAEDISQLRDDLREVFDRLRKLEQWQSFVLGATAAFWVFTSLIAWWLGTK